MHPLHLKLATTVVQFTRTANDDPHKICIMVRIAALSYRIRKGDGHDIDASMELGKAVKLAKVRNMVRKINLKSLIKTT